MNDQKAKHTPGPWTKTGAGKYFSVSTIPKEQALGIVKTYDRNVVCVINECDEKEMKANAALISAAPDLLEALQSMEMAMIGYTHQNDITRNALSKARAAIAKATGNG